MDNALGGILAVAAIFASSAAWLTHLYVCFSDDRCGFVITSAIMFPIAIVHGIGILCGVW